jgi:hypothetical protein
MWGLGEKTERAVEYDCADRIWCSLSCSTSFARVIISCVPLLILPAEHTSNLLPTHQNFLKLAERRGIREQGRDDDGRKRRRGWEEQRTRILHPAVAGSAAGSRINAQDYFCRKYLHIGNFDFCH